MSTATHENAGPGRGQNGTTSDEQRLDGRTLIEDDSLLDAVSKFYRHPTPIFITTLFAVGWVGKFIVGGWSWWDLALVGGLLAFWPVQEWLIHVFVLHLKPIEIFGHRFELHLAKKHREHHGDPWYTPDAYAPFRSLLMTVPLGLGVWFLVAPNWGIAFMGAAAYATLGLAYEWTHFLVHTNYRPKTNFYRRLWKNHRLHHFKNENYWYGVTMLSGDTLLGTSPDVTCVETSATCRTLGVEDTPAAE
ncbi:MAG: sterol desaturase family protein [Myxococcota bacterium]